MSHEHYETANSLGDAKTRAAIKDFFKKYFDIQLTLKSTYVRSAVTPGKVVDDWHLSFIVPSKRNEMPGFQMDLDEIFQKADEEIGIPQPVSDDINHEEAFDNFKDFTITMLNYVKPEEPQHDHEMEKVPAEPTPPFVGGM